VAARAVEVLAAGLAARAVDVVMAGPAPRAADAAHRVAERIRAALRDATASAATPLTLSIGIATLAPDVDSSHALLHAADRALYAAKDQGRDQAVVVRAAAA
jgi:diguanylate cyclase (GGDEF)-like protein